MVQHATEHPSGRAQLVIWEHVSHPTLWLPLCPQGRHFGFNISVKHLHANTVAFQQCCSLAMQYSMGRNSIKILRREKGWVRSHTDQNMVGLGGWVDAKSVKRLKTQCTQYWYVLATYKVLQYVTRPGCFTLFISAYVADSCLLKTYCHNLALKGMQCPTPPAAPAGPLLVSFIHSFLAKNSTVM